MNYYFFMQSLFKKKIRNIYLYPSISNIFLFPSTLYTHSTQYTLTQNHPKQSHRAFNQLIRTTNKSWRTDAIVQQYRFSIFKELAHTILRKYRTNLSTQNKTVSKGRKDQRGAHNN